MTWIEKYELLLSDELNTKQIRQILDVRHEKAKEIRIEINAQQMLNDKPLADPMKIPTELFLEYIGKNIKYFEDKMIRESKINKYKAETS